MITPKKRWHSPINVYLHLQDLQKTVSSEDIESKREFQKVREARVGAVVALAIFKRTGKATYLQLYEPDPPDVILMQQTGQVPGQRDITQLEITTYLKTRETLLEQLKRKDPKGWHKYSENYILAVNLGTGLEVDYEPIKDYLNTNKTPFPVWTVQQVSDYPNTIAEVVVINPEIRRLTINVGEAATVFQKLKLPGVINSKRVANPKSVKAVYVGRSRKAPWDDPKTA